MKNSKKLIAMVIIMIFILSNAAPALASPSGGLVQITDFSGGNGGFFKGNSETIYFGSYWQNTLKSGATDKRNPANYEKTGIKWRVLSTNAPLNPDDASKTGVLLLSDQVLYGAQFNSRWRTPKDSWNYGRKQDIAEGQANEWVIRSAGRTEGQSTQSDIRETLNTREKNPDDSGKGFAADAFSDGEYGAIAETTHIFGGEKLKGYYKRNYVSSERIFLLSYDEAIDSSYGFSSEKWDHNSRQATVTNYSYYISMYGNPERGVLRSWWLRSPALIYNYEVARVTRDGKIENRRGENVGYGVTGVRPAFNLNPESILFLSAAEGGKGDVNEGEGFKLDTGYDGSKGWKMTLKSSDIATPTGVDVTQDGHIGYNTVDELAKATGTGEMDLSNGLTFRKSGNIKVAYTGKDTKADFVSAIAATGEGTADNPYVYENYAKISANSSESNKALPLGNLDPNKEYTLLIFAEQIGKDSNNSTNYMTDYASETQKFKINSGETTYVGKLSNTYKEAELTAKLAGKFNLSFDAVEYKTGLNVVGDSTITAGIAGTTLKGNVDIAEGVTLTTANAFTFKGNNTIDGALTGENVTLSGGTTTVGTKGKIENNLKVAGGGTLSLDANKYGVEDGVKNVMLSGGTVRLTGTDTTGVLGKHIINGGKVVLSSGTSFGEGVKIFGGEVELEKDVEFSATNLDGINNLAAPTTANKAAIYNFALKIEDNKGISQHDQINLSGVATGHIKLGDVVYLPGSSDDTHWTVNESKQVQYLSNIVTGTNIVIDNTLGVAMPGSDGASYFFSQAYDPNDASKPLSGYLNVKRGNTYTLWEVVGSEKREDGSGMLPEQKNEARSVNIYTLNANGSGAYVAGKDFTALKAPGAMEEQLPRELTIKGLGAIAFKGNGSTTGIIINSLKNLIIDGVTEISGWKDNTAFTVNGGDLKFTGDNTLELKDGIMNNNGGSVIFDQDIILTGKLSCTNTGNYLNKETRTMKVADVSNLAMPEFINNGILNLGDGSAADKTLGSKIDYVLDTAGEATLNFNGSGTITATETIEQKVVNVNTNINMQADLTTTNGTNVADGKNLMIGASNLKSAVNATGTATVTLKDGTLGNYTITGGAIVIDGDVTASADNLKSNKGITNASNTFTLNGGMLIDSVYDADGTLKIGGTVEIASDKTVENKVVINGTNTLTANANSLKSATAISNASGIFKVTGGTILAGVTGAGTTEIGDGTNSAEVTLGNNASIAGKVAIKAQSKFIADFTKLSGSIDNAGTFVVTGSTPITIGKQITGVGTTQFGDGSSALAVTFEGTGQIDGNAKIAANSQLTLSDFSNIGGDLTVDANGKLIITANGPINKEIKGLGTTQVGDDSNHVDVTLGDIGSIFGDVAINAQSKLTVENFIRIGGTIDNAGMLVLTGTNTIDWKILGATGTTQIGDGTNPAEVTLVSGGSIAGNVAIKANSKFTVKNSTTIAAISNEGTLESEVEKLVGTNSITNSGTFVTYGELNKLSGLTNSGTVQIAPGQTLKVTEDMVGDKNLGGTLDLNDSTLDMQKAEGTGAVYSTLAVDYLKGNGALKIEATVKNGAENADKIAYANVAGSPTVTLTNIILKEGFTTHTTGTPLVKDGLLTVLLGDSTNVTFNVGTSSGGSISTQLGHYLYTFERGTGFGTLKVTETVSENITLTDYITGTTEGRLINTYAFAENETLNSSVTTGSVFGDTRTDYNIGMNGKNLTGNGNDGIVVAADKTLTIDGDGGTISGFNTALTVNENGTLGIYDINFGENATAAISNNGTLKLSGENTFVSKLTGTETATTTNYGRLNISADNLDVVLTNAENATLNLGSGKLTKAILGTGTTQIGDGTNNVKVTLGAGVSMEGNVAIKAKGKFTVENFTTTAAISNSGTLELLGENTCASELTGSGVTTNNGTLNISANNLKLFALTNYGTVILTGGTSTSDRATMNSAIVATDTSKGELNFGNGTAATFFSNDKAITQNAINIKANADVINTGTLITQTITNEGKLESAISLLNATDGITNDGALILTGGTSTSDRATMNSAIVATDTSKGELNFGNGTAATFFSNDKAITQNAINIKANADVINTGTLITQTITNEGKLESAISLLNATDGITNDGALILTGGTSTSDRAAMNSAIFATDTSKGELNFGKGTDAAYISNDKAIMQNAINVKANADVINTGTLTAQTITNEGIVELDADKLVVTGSITNAGTFVTYGELNKLSGLSKETNSGTVKIASDQTLKVTDNKNLGGILDLNNSTLDMQKAEGTGAVYSTLTVAKLKGNGDLKINANANESVKKADNISFTSVVSTPVINLASINLAQGFSTHATKSTPRTETDWLTVLDGSGAASATLKVGGTTGAITTQLGNYSYKFTTTGSTAGKLTVTETYNPISLAEYISGVAKARGLTSYSFETKETLASAVTTGSVAGDTRTNYVVDMNGNNLVAGANHNNGITVSNGRTLSVDGKSGTESSGKISGFNTALTVNAGGTLEIKDVNFSDNTTDIANAGTLNLNGEVAFSKGISGVGTTNVNADNTIASGVSVKQGVVTVASGKTLTNKGLIIAADITNKGTLKSAANTLSATDSITNDGTLTLTGGADAAGRVALASDVTSSATTTKGTVNFGDGTNNAYISNAKDLTQKDILVDKKADVTNTGTLTADTITNKGKLETNAGKLVTSNEIKNDGTLALTGGKLAQLVDVATAGQMGTIDLQAATEIAAQINDQIIKATNGYSTVADASYIASDILTFDGGGFDFQDGKVTEYTVDGLNLIGNGYLKLDVDLANEEMDRFNTNAVSGSEGAKLHVTALTLLSDAKKNKTNIVFATSDSLKGDVVSDVTHVASDMWKYLVAYDKETGEFAFTKNGRNEPDKPEVSETTKSVADTANAINLAWLETTGTLQKRLGDLRGGEASNTGWARFQRSNDDHNGARKLNVSGNLYQLGYDVALKNNTAARGYFGLSVEHFDGSQSYKIGGGDVKSTSLSAYYTKIYDSGHYFDFIFRYGRYESDTTSYDAGLSTKLDYGMNGVTLSGEYGYRANIGKNGFYFEPQAEVIYGYLAGAKKTSSRGILADIDSTNHFVTRLGVALGKKVKNFNYYLRGSYYHDFAGSTNILYGDASYKQDSARNWWELSLGGGWNMTDASYFYAELTKHFKDVSNSINFNLGFRFTL
ncbi:MAG: DUF6273 domain-containing protein [Synergistaceae bacterium]|nr:DUF6273 domain-containing protein [Synergistaceae bacterium]